jgi:hypothetical protein
MTMCKALERRVLSRRRAKGVGLGLLTTAAALIAVPAAEAVVVENSGSTVGGTATITVACPTGTHVVSGGGSIDSGGRLFGSAKSGNGWRASGHTPHPSGSATVTVEAICGRRDYDLRRRSAHSSSQHSVTARCHDGERVVSGGGYTTGNGSLIESRRRGRRGWILTGVGGVQSATAYVYCTVRRLRVTRVSNTSAISSSPTTAHVGCPPGTRIISGGGFSPNGFLDEILKSGNGWFAGGDPIGGSSNTTVFAYCRM